MGGMNPLAGAIASLYASVPPALPLCVRTY